ncbi:MAG: SH3 domain-containing protein [Candidatus Howiella sp.]
MKILIRRFAVCLLGLSVLLSVLFPAAASAKEVLTGIVQVDSVLNVRSGAGTGYSVLDTLPSGQAVYVTGTCYTLEGAKWYAVYYDKDGGRKTGYVHSDYVSITGSFDDGSDTGDFEVWLDAQGFPESYRPALRTLHKAYPNWVFEAQHITPSWEEALKSEQKFGVNMVSYIRPDSWKSVAPQAYDPSTGVWTPLDGASWVAASEEITAYYLDPRNFLDASEIFLFATHAYDSTYHTLEAVQRAVSGTFLDAPFPEDGFSTYAEAILYAGQQAGVNPCVLAAMILVEQGNDGRGGCISGTISGYEGIYNYLNIGAYTTDTMSAVERGLWWAAGGTGDSYGRPWNTRLKSLVGSAQYYADGYIEVGQDTLYLKKFDVVNDTETGLYWHQYMANIEGAQAEAYNLKKAYSGFLDSALVFKIPVYAGIPDELCIKPTGSDTVAPRLLKADIAALPEVEEITLGHAAEVSALRTRYNALTDMQKPLVTNLPRLEAAELKLLSLQPGEVVPGDLDRDGLVTVSDVVMLRQMILLELSDTQTLARGDLDADGKITVSDVVALRQKILNG